MRIWQGVFLSVLLVPLVLVVAGQVDAASLSGRSSTALEWYDNAEGDTAVPVFQYLQVKVKDLGADGYNFKAYGRLAEDFQQNDDVESRLYYAYLEKKGILSGLDFRLGRQFISTTAGASMMDGLQLLYRISDDYKLRIFGGGDVKFYEDYTLSDVIDGIELSGQFLDDSLDLSFSYLQKWESGLLAQDLIGIDVDYDFKGKLWLYSELQFDILSERTSYVLLGGKYRCNSPLTLRAEYLYSLPVFSSTSIYSVFAVEEYREAMAELTYKLSRSYQVFARYTHEFYKEFEDANVYEAGIEKLRTDNLYGYLTGTFRIDDDGQDLYGFKAYANYQFMPQLSAGLGANVDVLEREIAFFNTDDTDQDETTSSRIWVDAKYAFTKKVNLKGKFEYIESDLWDYYNRGTIRLNVLF